MSLALVLGGFLFTSHLPAACAQPAGCAVVNALDKAAGGQGQASPIPACAAHADCSVFATIASRPIVAAQGRSAARPVMKLQPVSRTSRPPAPPPQPV